jgi:hypothetical protein
MFEEVRGEHTTCSVDRASKVHEVLKALLRPMPLRHGRRG